MSSWPTYRAAESALLERRRAQRGSPTLGDDADRSLLLALASLPPEAASLARESGERIGARVWSRRYHEEGLSRAVHVLSDSLLASGLGALRLEQAFHRSARVRYEPAPLLAGADEAVRDAFLEGALRGFLVQTHNCDASARRVASDVLQVELGEGRDVNAGPGVA